MSRVRSTESPARSPLALVVSTLTLCISSCASGAPGADLPNERLWESAHFRYHTRATDGTCEAVLGQLERHFDLLQSYLGFPSQPQSKVDYYKFLDRSDYDLHSGCPDDSGSCIEGRAILSPMVLEDHELIHAYLAPLGLPPSFFIEGTATVLSCGHSWAMNPRPWREVIALPFGNDRAYLEGPWFVGYLMHSFGPQPLLSLYQRLNGVTLIAKIAEVFQEVYGHSLDEIWDAALASDRRVRCINLWPCAGAPLALDGSSQTISASCDGSDAYRTFELDARHELVFVPEFQFAYAPTPCGREFSETIGGDSNTGGVASVTSLASYPAGKYFVSAWDESASISIRVLSSQSIGLDCHQLEATDLLGDAFASSHFELALPTGGGAWFVKLRPASERAVCLGATIESVEVEECVECAESPSCKPLVCATPGPTGSVTLRVTPKVESTEYVTVPVVYEASMQYVSP